MPLYLRPTSFELEIAKIETNQNPIKHLDVLREIFHILESKPDMQHINIQGFERNTTARYTVTLDTRDQRDTLMDYFVKNPTGLEFTYQASHANLQGGRLTISGIPVEYPNIQIQELLAKTVDIINIKHGTYRQYPTVKNGLRHITYRKQYRVIPTTLQIPEGYTAYIKQDGVSQGCYVCKGNHLKRNCPYNQKTEEEAEIVKHSETDITNTTKQTHQQGPDHMEGTKPSKTFTLETENLNENQDMKDDKDNLTPVDSQILQAGNPQPTYDHLKTSTPAYNDTEKQIIQASVSSTYSSDEDATTLIKRMEDLVHCMRSEHKEENNLGDVSITEITPYRDIQTGKADILSLTYEEKSGKEPKTSTHRYKVYDPLIIANFDLLLMEQDIHKENQEEYVTNPTDNNETNDKHEEEQTKKVKKQGRQYYKARKPEMQKDPKKRKQANNSKTK